MSKTLKRFQLCAMIHTTNNVRAPSDERDKLI